MARAGILAERLVRLRAGEVDEHGGVMSTTRILDVRMRGGAPCDWCPPDTTQGPAWEATDCGLVVATSCHRHLGDMRRWCLEVMHRYAELRAEAAEQVQL